MRYPGFRKEIDGDALQLYLCAEYIPGSRCIFKNTWKLLPGEILTWTAAGVSRRRWWTVEGALDAGGPYPGSYEEALEELDALVEDAVRLLMISDVPLGVFLSNGVDSSLIAAKMKKVSAGPIRTFTAAFREEGFDESEAAGRVAAWLGAEHRSELLDAEEGKRLLTRLPEFWDEPMADPSSVATMLVSRMARREVTVALSGDAGDELFYGYNTYAHFERLRRWVRVGRLLGRADGAFPLRRLAAAHNSRRLTKLLCMTSEEALIDADLFSYRDRYREITEGSWDFSDFSAAVRSGGSLPEKAMLHDLTTYLPGDILTKVDRASMAFSLELRAPLLDCRIVEFALRLPLSYKVEDGVRKRILKDLLYREIPKELIGQKKKGFRIPFADWLRNDFRALLRDYCSEDYLRGQNLFDPRTVRKMLQSFERTDTPDYAREVWTFLLFQLWYDRYMA
jgi:asparagine synthase (glutamine-hydrolysing)